MKGGGAYASIKLLPVFLSYLNVISILLTMYNKNISQPKSTLGSQSMDVQRMEQILKSYGVVESNSPKNRKKLYEILKKENISFSTEVIGYTSGIKSMCPYVGKKSGGYTLGHIVKWIHSKRILKEDLKKACDIYSYQNEKFEDIESVFNDGLTKSKIRNILRNSWGNIADSTHINSYLHNKYGPFDNCELRKTIVRITLDKFVPSPELSDEFDMEICI